MKLDHCHSASCIQIIEALTKEHDRLAAENGTLLRLVEAHRRDKEGISAENAEIIKALEDIASGEIGINIAMRLAKGVLARVKAEK